MVQSASVWLVIFVAVVAANLPFVAQRFLMVIQMKAPKTLGIRLLELVIFYFIAGGLGLLLENRAGQIAPQGWEFYAITGALFITLAFPGFIYRYLLKHRE
jgi:predicted transporter